MSARTARKSVQNGDFRKVVLDAVLLRFEVIQPEMALFVHHMGVPVDDRV